MKQHSAKQLHPMTWFMRKAVKSFVDQGFEIYEGEEITSEWNNFDSLNTPDDHPSRDVQDTFWLTDGRVMRTHTTSMQMEVMKDRKPPVRMIVPGRCFRNEATDSTHETTFYQLDGFVIDKNINLGHLKTTLEIFFKDMFGQKTEIRTRPSHFPFVEPGMEVDVKLKGKWLEMMGAGIIHPKVIKNMKLDPKEWQGFAFGGGVDRMLMIQFGIDDIRREFSGDFKFLKQFSK